ncbi:MAG: CheR family methyltransferase [Stellaceae bacterium]
MTDRLDETLRDLAHAMADHGRVLASMHPPKPVAPAADDPRNAVIRGLLRGVERRCGLRMDEALAAKLRAVLSRVALDELVAWVRRLDRLPAGHAEWLALFHSLTVHETYFFRDVAQLTLMRDGAFPQLIVEAAAANRRLRLWSAGCATGEEVYTLAALALAALATAGHAAEAAEGYVLRHPWELDVLGTDLSPVVLKRALAARYETGELSPFRALPQPLVRLFPAVEGRGQSGLRTVRDDVRRHGRFQFFNLLSEIPPERGFDLVACRNVLVYLAPASRRVAQRVVESAVRPRGFLLLGPTDSPPDPRRFEPVWGDHAVLFRKIR